MVIGIGQCFHLVNHTYYCTHNRTVLIYADIRRLVDDLLLWLMSIHGSRGGVGPSADHAG